MGFCTSGYRRGKFELKYYAHHIGDFDRATRHLSRIERSVYRDLIDLYYDTEQQLSLEVSVLCRRIIARTNEEATAVEQVLNEFFTQTPTGWYHDRCEEEIEAYRASNSQKSAAGKASAAKRAAKREQAINGIPTTVGTSVEQSSNGSATNHEPVTINQEPETNIQEGACATDVAVVDDLFDAFWAEYPKKVGKDDARKAWKKRKVSQALADQMIAAVRLQRESQQWKRDGGQYIPNPSTWINQGRWQDEVPAARQSAHSGFSTTDYNKGINEDGTFD